MPGLRDLMLTRGSARFVLFSALVLIWTACSSEDPDKSNGNFAAPVTVDAGADSAVIDAAASGPVDAGLIADASADASIARDAAPTMMDAALTDAGPLADAAFGSDAALGDAAPSADAMSSSDAAPSDAASDATQTDGATNLPAAQARTVMVGTASRTFLLYIPKALDKAKPVPLVSVHHGFTMTGKIMEEITTWKAVAERAGFAVAFADGGDFLGPWNVGENVCNIGQVVAGSSTQDDLGFVQAIIASVDKDQAIDKSKVFVAGFSMGGYFANHVGCQGRSFVRAMSAHSGGTYGGSCPGTPVPVLLIHGDADGLIDYECGTQAHDLWVERNGCQKEVVSEAIKGGSCAWNQGCPMGRAVGFCTMKGMDHGWAGAATSGAGAWLTAPLEGNLGYGGGVQYADAAELMWKFFEKSL